MTEDQRLSCQLIVHSASAAAAAVGIGFAQIPVADSAIIIPIQVSMVIALGKLFDKHLTDSTAVGMILGSAGSYIGRALSQVLVGWVPGLGNVMNASTAAGITEIIGWSVADKFDQAEAAVI